ncbi:MAG: hypothetical protein ABSH22_11610 [Tepidisphaeraceae bacterium]|jgi:hypothetical protein
MEIEDTIARESYREFDMVHLRHGKDMETRWHITHKESGMNRSYGYATSENEARLKIDGFISRRT